MSVNEITLTPVPINVMIFLKIYDAFLKSALYVTWYSDRNFASLENINRQNFLVFMDQVVIKVGTKILNAM
jgi:hypothetical protein